MSGVVVGLVVDGAMCLCKKVSPSTLTLTLTLTLNPHPHPQPSPSAFTLTLIYIYIEQRPICYETVLFCLLAFYFSLLAF